MVQTLFTLLLGPIVLKLASIAAEGHDVESI